MRPSYRIVSYRIVSKKKPSYRIDIVSNRKKAYRYSVITIELLEKLCSINIKMDVQTALLAFHAPYDRSVVCASLPSIDLLEILRSQSRGWFSPAMVQRKIYKNINWFISTATFTVPLEFVKGQLLEMRLKRGA